MSSPPRRCVTAWPQRRSGRTRSSGRRTTRTPTRRPTPAHPSRSRRASAAASARTSPATRRQQTHPRARLQQRRKHARSASRTITFVPRNRPTSATLASSMPSTAGPAVRTPAAAPAVRTRPRQHARPRRLPTHGCVSRARHQLRLRSRATKASPANVPPRRRRHHPPARPQRPLPAPCNEGTTRARPRTTVDETPRLCSPWIHGNVAP